MKRNSCIVAVIVTTVLGLAPGAAKADFGGANMSLFYDDPTRGTHIDTRNFVVVSPVEAERVLGFMNLDIQSRRVVFSTSLSGNTTASLPPRSFSGFNLFDSGNQLPTITGVSIVSNANFAGFDASRLSFDADNVYTNFQGLVFRPDSLLVLDVTFDTPLTSNNFAGRDLTLFYDDPELGTHIDTRNFVVQGVEAERILGFLDVDVAASQITVTTGLTGNTTAFIPSTAFSGLNLSDAQGLVQAITGVTVNPSSNLTGFDVSRLSFDSDNVYTNFQGLTFRADTRLVLDVTFAPVGNAPPTTDAPEPTTGLLIALIGGAGLAVRARRFTARR